MISDVPQEELIQRVQDKIFPQDKIEREKKAAPVKEAKPEPKPEPEPEAPVEEAAPAGQDGVPGGSQDEPVEEVEEVEFNGTRYQIPKELKPALDGYKDYTEKTMTAAERQRQADLIIEQTRRAQALHQKLQPKYEALSELARNVKAYEAVDWNTWIQSDPVEAQKGMLQLQVLRDKHAKAQYELQQAANEEMRAINEIRERLVSENEKVLKSKIKNWNAETRKSLDAFAENTYGYSKEELSQVFDSRVVRMINDAKQWHDLQASKPQAQKKATQVATLKPSATQQKNAQQTKEGELKRAIRVAKTDQEKAKAIEALILHRLH